jgi:hypothetical protein
MIRSPFFRPGYKGISPCVSSRIQPHDIVEGTRWRDPVTLTSRGVNSKMFARILILPQQQQIEKISVEISPLPIVYFQHHEGNNTPQARKTLDIYLSSMYRQARGLHITTYPTRQKDGGQAPGVGMTPPAHRGLRPGGSYHADYLHRSGTFRARQRVHLPGSGPGQDPIF